jgi:NADPH-dependent F420 reductase
MRIGIVGGTGKEGMGLAIRWAKAGHDVVLGSRDGERGKSRAEELAREHGVKLRGTDNAGCCESAEVVLLAIPFGGHEATCKELAGVLTGKVVIDITVPLKPPNVREVNLPSSGAAALETQAIVGEGTHVVAALHHISSVHLGDADHAFDCDVLVCGDDGEARDTVINLVGDLGLRGIDAGKLKNAIALESLTPVLLYINKRYKAEGAGIRITGIG